MPKQHKSYLGDCKQRGIETKDTQMCDWFVFKRNKGTYRVLCRNCKYFKRIEISEKPPKKVKRKKKKNEEGEK